MRTIEGPSPHHPSPVSRRRADAERLEAQLAEWTAIIAQYRACAKRAGASTRLSFDRTADELQRLRNEAGTQVLLLKGAMDLDWEDAVAELDQSWATVRSTFEQAEARL